MALSKVSPLPFNVPIVYPDTGWPSSYFQNQIVEWLREKQITDILAEGAVPNTTQVIAGAGLTGGGALTANVTLDVGAGTGITVNTNSVALANTAVTPGTYGDATHVGQFTVDAQGRLTAASSVAISFPAAGVTTTGSPASGNLTKFSGATTITNGDLSGDVTTAGTLATAIANGAVSLAKMANVATSTVFYRKTAGTGAPEVQTLATLKTDLGITGTNSGDQTITLTGDVTGSGTGSFAATIANDAVTYAKMQNVSATSKILGRKTAGSGDTEECSLSDVLDFIGSAAWGDILYRGSASWARLGIGGTGQVLQSNGAGANPSWGTVGGGGGGVGGANFAWATIGTPVASATATATHGTGMVPLVDIIVSGLWAYTNTVAGATYRVSIYTCDTSFNITAVLADSGDIASPGTVTGTNVGAKFGAPVTMAAGGTYAVCFRRTDATDTTAVGIYGLSNTNVTPQYPNLPLQVFAASTQVKFLTLAKKTPAVSDAFTVGGGGYYQIGVLHTL